MFYKHNPRPTVRFPVIAVLDREPLNLDDAYPVCPVSHPNYFIGLVGKASMGRLGVHLAGDWPGGLRHRPIDVSLRLEHDPALVDLTDAMSQISFFDPRSMPVAIRDAFAEELSAMARRNDVLRQRTQPNETRYRGDQINAYTNRWPEAVLMVCEKYTNLDFVVFAAISPLDDRSHWFAAFRRSRAEALVRWGHERYAGRATMSVPDADGERVILLAEKDRLAA